MAEELFSREERERLEGSEFAVCAATFYDDLAERLVNGAVEAFAAAGISPASVDTYEVPGAFELPLAAKLCAESGRFAGVACVGVVIRGETAHWEYVAGAAARGIARAALDTGIPTTFGVITALTAEQAWARAGGAVGNRGEEAALAAIEMSDWLRRVGAGARRLPGRRASRGRRRTSRS